MSHLRAFVAPVLAAALTPLLLTAPGTAMPVSADTATATTTGVTSTTTARKAQSARLTVLPKIAQKGSGAKNADKAKAVGEVKVSPAKGDRKVQVQVSRDAGATWSNLGKAKKTNGQGIAYFTPAAASTGTTWTYRAQVAKFKGSPGFTTGTASDRWSLLFQDQFSGSSLNRAVWTTRGTTYDKASNRKCSKASPKMAKVGSGVLTLQVKKDPARRGDVCKWRSPGGKTKKFSYFLNGHVGTSAFSFRYGVAAARVKFQEPQGMHGSFWKNASGEPEGSRAVEIDTVEFFGKDYNKGGLAQFLHYNGRKIGGLQPSANAVLSGTDNWWKKYHVFSVHWSPSGYSFRIDGTETYRTSKATSDKQVISILSLLSSDWELDKMPKSGKGSMKVDWFRVWQDQGLAARNLQ